MINISNINVEEPIFLRVEVLKIRINVEGFDDISHGGLPRGRTTLVSGTPGTGKTLFTTQCLYNGIVQFDEHAVLVTFKESPTDIIQNALSFGWHLQELIDARKLFILDALPDPEGQDIAGDFDLSALIERIQYAIRKYKAKRVDLCCPDSGCSSPQTHVRCAS